MQLITKLSILQNFKSFEEVRHLPLEVFGVRQRLSLQETYTGHLQIFMKLLYFSNQVKTQALQICQKAEEGLL